MWGYLSIGLVSVVATGVAAVLVARRFAAPTAKLLTGVCLFLLTVAASQVVVLTPSPLREMLATATGLGLPGDYWLVIALGLTFPASGLWLLFSMEYTGRGSRLRRQVGILTAALIILCYSAGVYVASQTGGSQSVDSLVAGVLASGLFFISPLASLGSVLVAEAALRRNAVPLGEGVALATGGILFVYAPIVGFNLDTPVAVPTLLTGASLTLGVAVERYPVFETLPVARIAARDRLVDETENAVVLVDEQACVVDLNPAATSLFGTDSADFSRQRLREVVPAAPAPRELAADSTPARFRIDGRRIEATASRVTGEYGTPVGHLLVCRDVTEQRRRDRRLRVLARFLAGTVERRATGVARRADRLAGGGTHQSEGQDATPAAVGRDIRRTADLLRRLTATTRRLDRALSTRGTGPSDVAGLAREVATEREQVALTVEDGSSGTTATVDPAVLRAVLELLLEARLASGASALQLTVRPSRDPGPVIELRGDSSASGEGDGAQQNTTVEPSDGWGKTARESASRTKPVVALSRLALEHAEATVERPQDTSLRIQLRADGPASTSAVPDDARGEVTPRGRAQTRGGARSHEEPE